MARIFLAGKDVTDEIDGIEVLSVAGLKGDITKLASDESLRYLDQHYEEDPVIQRFVGLLKSQQALWHAILLFDQRGWQSGDGITNATYSVNLPWADVTRTSINLEGIIKEVGRVK